MLIVTAKNVTPEQENEICAYEVYVRINKRVIWKGLVQNHQRSDGFPALLRKIADTAEKKP